MGRNSFRFKRFGVNQEGCAMKVGTDGVLLGAWCRMRPEDKLILDMGTGTGVIALMLAQRTEAFGSVVEAVEIDGPSCLKAQENFSASDWADRIRLHCVAVQEFARESPSARFDHIISNPPYFVDSLNSPDAARNAARHTASLSHKDIILSCCKLLAPDGLLSLILPPVEGEKMIETAVEHGSHLSRLMRVMSTPQSSPKRLLLEFSQRSTDMQELPPLTIEDAGAGTFSEEYRALTRDFYLNF